MTEAVLVLVLLLVLCTAGSPHSSMRATFPGECTETAESGKPI